MRVVSPTAFLDDTQDAGTNRVATRFRQPRKHMYRLNWGLLSVGKSRTSNPSRHGCIFRPNVSGERRESLCHCVTQQNHPDLAGSSSIFTASHPQILHVTLNCHWTSCRWALGAGGKIHILCRYPRGSVLHWSENHSSLHLITPHPPVFSSLRRRKGHATLTVLILGLFRLTVCLTGRLPRWLTR